MRKSLCLVLLIYSHLTSGSLSKSTDQAITMESLDSLTSLISARYFNESCILIFSSESSRLFHSSPRDVVNVKYFDLDKDNEDNYIRDVLIPSMEIGCSGHIIQTINPRVQLTLIERTYVKVSQRIPRFFLVLPISDKQINNLSWTHPVLQKETDHLFDVFNSTSIKSVPNLLVVVPAADRNNFVLYTHKFGGHDDLFRQMVLLDVYEVSDGTFLYGANQFPDKIKDLEGRTFTATVLEYAPYIAKDPLTGELFGTEWNVVVEFCNRHNCTLRPLVDNVYLFGEIFDNATGNGVLGNVVEDKADVGFGSIDLWYHEWLFLDLGPAFVRTAVTCLVPPPRPLAQWATPIIPFDGLLWYAVITSVIIDAITIYVVFYLTNWIHRYSNLKDEQRPMTPVSACLAAIGLSVEQSLNTDVNRASSRVLVLALLLVSLLISTSYGSGLSSVLTVPRFEKPINTIEDLEASGIRWSAPHEAWIFSLYGSNESWLLNLIDHFVVLPPNLTTAKAYEAEMGFCVERLPGGNYAIQDYLPSDAVEHLHLMSGDIYWTYTVSMLKKSSPFTERYATLELELLASGIPSYWEGLCTMLSLDPKTQYAVPDKVFDAHPVQLNIAQIQGAFLFLCCGLTSAAVTFVLEIARQSRKARNIARTMSGPQEMRVVKVKTTTEDH
ncbi:uncharacterized protein LOC105691216 isoform X2 [Athalia rosae]|uniref:uncharacterized protein LOC105691216 isoform X2 n=1 Tax=Athalia rosae TaxID=37344 RepID=UPI002033BACD|nr:uncharacterized protein LOC105691216 isoform X2 [Athalia rosae]